MKNRVEQHHVKYEEIHGEDKIVMLTSKEHKRLHLRLRKEGKCNISAKELEKISKAAMRRSPGAKKYRSNYQNIIFSESFGLRTRLHEVISYNQLTGHVRYSADFRGAVGYTLPKIDIPMDLEG